MAPFPWMFLLSIYSTSVFVASYDLQSLIPTQSVMRHTVFTPLTSNTADDCPRLNPDVDNGTLIDQLWKANCDIVLKFLENTFSTAQAAQTANGTLESFQYYSVQDYYYLLETVQHKAFLMTTFPPSTAPELAANINDTIQSMQKDLKYASDFEQSLTGPLNVSQEIINKSNFQAAGLGYVKWLEANTNLGWYAFEVSRVACIYGWAELANTLSNSGKTNNESLFFKEWIQPNLGWGSGARLSQKLQKDINLFNNSETFEVYNQLFREGMTFEVAFFESALGKTLNDAVSTVSRRVFRRGQVLPGRRRGPWRSSGNGVTAL